MRKVVLSLAITLGACGSDPQSPPDAQNFNAAHVGDLRGYPGDRDLIVDGPIDTSALTVGTSKSISHV